MTRNIIYIIAFMFAFLIGSSKLSAQCNPKLVDICVSKNKGASYMKHFIAKLKAAEPNKPTPVAKYAVVLNKGSVYRMNTSNASEYEGKATLQLYDESDKLVGTTFFNGKDFTMFDFPCSKTGKYTIYISFQDGKMGCAVGVLAIVKK